MVDTANKDGQNTYGKEKYDLIMPKTLKESNDEINHVY